MSNGGVELRILNLIIRAREVETIMMGIFNDLRELQLIINEQENQGKK